MLKIIENNPYRILGVYSTSSQKEVVANQGKMKAFLKVARPVTFPLDLNGVLPEVLRSDQSVADAISKLTVINLAKIEIGGLALHNVTAAVVKGQKAPLLLGQSVLSRLGKIEIDNNQSVIKITYKEEVR